MPEKKVKRVSSSGSVYEISGETVRNISECACCFVNINTATYFNLFLCPFKQRDMSVMTRVPNFIFVYFVSHASAQAKREILDNFRNHANDL